MFALTTMYLTEYYLLLEIKMLTEALNSATGSVLHNLVRMLRVKCSQQFWFRSAGTGGVWSPVSRNEV